MFFVAKIIMSNILLNLPKSNLLYLLFPLLYAEIHYHFPYCFSLLHKKEPEIIADAPYRVEPNKDIPILILIKDADIYPIILENITVYQNTIEGKRKFILLNKSEIINTHWYQKVFYLPYTAGENIINVIIDIRSGKNGKKRIRIYNDNYRFTSHSPLNVYCAEDSLPILPNWYYGDIHYHSRFTEDQVEFGAPLKETSIMADAMGLKWFAITDHSYDLDDMLSNYLVNDPNLQKWKDYLFSLEDYYKSALFKKNQIVLLRGLEVSCGNSENRNVHLLALGIREYIAGDGDSAEHWLKNKPTSSIIEVLENIQEQNGIAFAAHPREKVPFLQWLLLNRGNWKLDDLINSKCLGLEFWNGNPDYNNSLELWRKLLLKGEHKFITGGTDAHGNFNRFRQLHLPFIKMREHHQQLFGQVRTAVYIPEETEWSENALLNSMKNGQMIVTNGPFLDLRVYNELGEEAIIGGIINGTKEMNFKIILEAIVTKEYGLIEELKIYYGKVDIQEEIILRETKTNKIELEIKANNEDYIRAELIVCKNEKIYNAFTNPIWFSIK